MSLFHFFWLWVSTASHWHGPDGIPERVLQHAQYSFESLGVAAAVALPVGMLTGHTGRGGFLAANLANLGRALPTLGIVILVALDSEVASVTPVIVALTALALPQILVNTHEGIRGVPAEVTDAARGMGMSPLQVLLRVEVPVALPLILRGLRTAAVQVVATATIAAEVAIGGLGRMILDGLAEQGQYYGEVVAGAVLVVLLALLTELVFTVLLRFAVSPGVRARLRVS